MQHAPPDPHHEAREATAERDKGFSTLRAKLALAGYSLQIIAGKDGEAAYLVSKWNLRRELHPLASVIDWAKRAGVVQ